MKKQILCAMALAFFVNLSAISIQAEEKHPFGTEDMAALRSARPVAVSSDGETILYEVSFGGSKGRTNREWRLIAADGSNERKLTLAEHFAPLGFMKDGASLYGMLEVENKSQLTIVPLDADKPTVIIALKAGIGYATMSPDGSRFALLADPRPPDSLADTRTVVESDKTSLYVVNRDGSNGSWWCPGLTNITGLAWSADSSTIAVLSETPKLGYHYVHSFVDTCTDSSVRRVAEIPNAASGIAWTAGGNELAFISTTTQVITPDHVWTVPLTGGKPVDRTPDLDGSAKSLVGDTRDVVWVFVARGVQGEVHAFKDGILTPVYTWPEGTVLGTPVFPRFAGAPERLAFTVGDPKHAGNVAVAKKDQLVKITHEGDEQLANVALGPRRVVDWTAKDGPKLQGIVTFPAGYTEGKSYPFLVLPHGGPEGNDFLYFDNWARFIAGLGYVVMQPQYRGSTGYGSDFLNAIYQHFGDRAYSDVDSATDYAVAQGWADPNRLAIFGWSAGGFMTSWTITQTNRYRAAIEGAGITDWLSFIPTSDVQQIDYDQRWQEKDVEPFLKFSAVMFADKVTTPLLILHGTNDIRVPMLQGLEYYALLAERGKTVRMVTYPGAPHFPTLWEQRRNVFEETAAWLAAHNR
ncbi:MAG: S9 family peptidase [Candidatus Aminicenantales bacterium]